MPEAREEAQNKELMRRWFEEVWNRGESARISDFRSPEAVAIGLEEGNSPSHGPTPFKAFFTNMREAFPDLHITIDDMLAEGDRVAVRLTANGTHQGRAFGITPSGRKVTFSGIVIARISDGKIVEGWNSLDRLELLRQIGALPADVVPINFLTSGT